jgi:hypothetical protein
MSNRIAVRSDLLSQILGLGAGSLLMLAVIVVGGFWYMSRPKPPEPWDSAAIQAEFLSLAASNERDVINLWYTVKNSTRLDYKINDVSAVISRYLVYLV